MAPAAQPSPMVVTSALPVHAARTPREPEMRAESTWHFVSTDPWMVEIRWGDPAIVWRVDRQNLQTATLETVVEGEFTMAPTAGRLVTVMRHDGEAGTIRIGTVELRQFLAETSSRVPFNDEVDYADFSRLLRPPGSDADVGLE